MRKQVGLKFEEEDLARWDVFAESQGLTRTSLIETAVERLISAGVEQAPSPAKGGVPDPAGNREHLARPGIRRVFVCVHKDRSGELDCKRRVSLRPEVDAATIPQCPEHGPMVRQANRPYRGQSTEPTPEQGWPEAMA